MAESTRLRNPRTGEEVIITKEPGRVSITVEGKLAAVISEHSQGKTSFAIHSFDLTEKALLAMTLEINSLQEQSERFVRRLEELEGGGDR